MCDAMRRSREEKLMPDEPETFAELLFRVEIELWDLFREIESDFQKLVDDTKAEFKRIHDEHFSD